MTELAKNFPKRSESGAKYAGWILFALVFTSIGAHNLMNANEFVGLVMFAGGIGMAMRETSLRMKAKKWARENGHV